MSYSDTIPTPAEDHGHPWTKDTLDFPNIHDVLAYYAEWSDNEKLHPDSEFHRRQAIRFPLRGQWHRAENSTRVGPLRRLASYDGELTYGGVHGGEDTLQLHGEPVMYLNVYRCSPPSGRMCVDTVTRFVCPSCFVSKHVSQRTESGACSDCC